MDYNALHPYPRYGAAVALARAGKTPAEVETPEALALLVAEAIEAALTRYTVRTLDNPKTEGTETLTFDWVEDPEPGSRTGQTAANGYYLAPHVVTSDGSAAGLLKAAHGFVAELRDGDALGKPTALKRSFAPLVAKVNAGTASPSDPKTTRLNAALTALATVTPDKAAAWSLGTAGLVPDLPLVDDRDPDRSPLLDYVRLFRRIRSRYYDTDAAMRTPVSKAGGYKRPRLHEGNFPEAPSNSALSALGVVASVGWWARHGDRRAVRDPEGWARRVLDLLAERPLLVVSYDGTRQEQFGHHLVDLALDGDLRAALAAVNRIRPVGFVNWNDKASKDKVELFRMVAGRFLRLFNRPALRDFLATRAPYPAELGFVFDAYFTTHAMPAIHPEPEVAAKLVKSARAYGAALNHAAYRYGLAEHKNDVARRGEAKARSEHEYKQRALVEFESAVQSAKSGPELLAKVGSRAGRLASYEMPSEAGAFMEAVASGDVDLEQARDLVTAFMRLSTYERNTNTANGADGETADATSAEPTASSQDDLSPLDRA